MTKQVYVDGSVFNNGRSHATGGYGVCFVNSNAEGTQLVQVIGGRLPAPCTNNIAELTGAVVAMKAALQMGWHDVKLFTDSQYVVNGFTDWMQGWERRGWRTREGAEVKNQNYWQALLELRKVVKARFIWVRGHSGDYWNELADSVAGVCNSENYHINLSVNDSNRDQVTREVEAIINNKTNKQLAINFVERCGMEAAHV